MIQDDFLKDVEAALKVQADANAAVELLKLKFQASFLQHGSKKQPTKKQAKDIAPIPAGFDDEQMEFRSKPLRKVPEVVSFMGLSRSKVFRLIDKGTLKSEQPKGPGTTVWVHTQSVIEYDGKTKEKSQK